MGRAYGTNLRSVTLIIGSDEITAFGEGGAVTVEPVSDSVEQTVGMNGDSVFARVNDNSAKVTVTVLQGSNAHRMLSEQYQEQQGEEILQDRAFYLHDSVSGTRIKDAQLIFARPPDETFAKGPTDRVYTMFLPNGYAPENYQASPNVI